MRAVNGVIGSKRSASSTAACASSGSSTSSCHCSGCSASSRTACASWLCVVSTPPASTLNTRLMHSTSDSRSPASSASISIEIEVVARVVAARPKQFLGIPVELLHRQLDLLALARHARRVELPLDPVRPVVQPRRVLLAARPSPSRSSATGTAWRTPPRTRSARSSATAAEQLLEERAHRRRVALDRPRRQRRVRRGCAGARGRGR